MGLWTLISASPSTFLTGFSGPWQNGIARSTGRATGQPSAAMDSRIRSFSHCAGAARASFRKNTPSEQGPSKFELQIELHPPRRESRYGLAEIDGRKYAYVGYIVLVIQHIK